MRAWISSAKYMWISVPAAAAASPGVRPWVNSGSLLGHYGEDAERASPKLLALGWVEYLSSDHHARGTPATARAVALLREHGGSAQAARLTEENPGRMLVGELPLPVDVLVPPETDLSWWQRLMRRRSVS